MGQIVLALLMVVGLSGCFRDPIIREEDSAWTVTGKVTQRVLVGLITLGTSEIMIASDKEREEQYAVTTSGFLKYRPSRPQVVIIWGNNAEAVSSATIGLQQMGFRVVERQEVQRLFDEQRFRLTYTPDSDADLLRIGQMVGADQVVFIKYDGQIDYDQVSVRGASVESGEILWAGQAKRPKSVLWSPEPSLVISWALARVWCPPERWNDRGGCRKPSSAQ